MPIKIFFCYAREDEGLLDQLKTHLLPLQREGLIDMWHDRDISAGAQWEQEINAHLEAARIILLLVSPDFMKSDYCYSVEMKRALERHERCESTVIPVIMRPVYWHGKPLGQLQALPTDGKPITGSSGWLSIDEALLDVTKGICKVAVQLAARPAPLPISQLRLLHTLKGHTGFFRGIAISPNGHTLVSGGEDRTIKIWDLSSGTCIHTLKSHTNIVWSVAINPDGQTFVSGSADHSIKIWNLHTANEVCTLSTDRSVFSVAISPDGQTLISGCSDGTLKIWSLPSGKPKRTTIFAHEDTIMALAISPDGQTLISGCKDGTLKIWNLYKGEHKPTISAHKDIVLALAISPDGQTFVSGCKDGTINIWNLHTGKEMRPPLSVSTKSVTSIVISPDGQTFVSGCTDGTISIWNLHSGNEIHSLKAHNGVTAVAISADGQTLINGNVDGSIEIWGI